MKRKLQLKKETLRTLSAEHLQQVASGSGSYDGCDAPMFMGSGTVTTRPRPMDVQPIAMP
jgi:hypothetical protein